MKNDFLSTIAAISTPRGKGGVALIRISGEEAVAVSGRCFSPRCGKKVADLEPRRAYFGDILLDGEPIDDGILTVFRAPASYTGEDMVEISCHGGVLVTKRVLEAVFKAGATPAAAGEFTRRAFVNGKLSLTKAEAVGEIEKQIYVDTWEQVMDLLKEVHGEKAKVLIIADGTISYFDRS